MNLNEQCLLKFLINPDEISELTEFFVKNLDIVEKNPHIVNN